MNPKSSISMSTSSAESFNQRASQKRLLHSDSSVSYQVNLPAASFRDDSIKEIVSRSVPFVGYDDDELETTTSRSFVHGFILVSIMICSLLAFICSKGRRCANFVDLSSIEDCSKYFHFYSTMNIVSCLVTFIIYFLHLIAQCDVLCLTRKKYQFEIMTIAIVCSLLLISSVCYSAHTDIFAESFILASLVLSGVSVLLYFVRIIILAWEMVHQRRKRKLHRQHHHHHHHHLPSSQSVRELAFARRSISKDQGSMIGMESSLPATRVISYVRNAQRKKTLSTSVSEDLDDDVFIQ